MAAGRRLGSSRQLGTACQVQKYQPSVSPSPRFLPRALASSAQSCFDAGGSSQSPGSADPWDLGRYLPAGSAAAVCTMNTHPWIRRIRMNPACLVVRAGEGIPTRGAVLGCAAATMTGARSDVPISRYYGLHMRKERRCNGPRGPNASARRIVCVVTSSPLGPRPHSSLVISPPRAPFPGRLDRARGIIVWPVTA